MAEIELERDPDGVSELEWDKLGYERSWGSLRVVNSEDSRYCSWSPTRSNSS